MSLILSLILMNYEIELTDPAAVDIANFCYGYHVDMIPGQRDAVCPQEITESIPGYWK